jgi:hypothetical protein
MKAISLKAIIRKYAVLLSVVYLFVPASAQAQSGGDYILEWSTIDGGGGTSSGAEYVLSGTAGQPDAGEMTGGQYELSGGFWPRKPLCLVNFEHFARFAEYWLQTGTGLPADLYEDQYNIVDWLDLGVFVDDWLYYCPYDWPLR